MTLTLTGEWPVVTYYPPQPKSKREAVRELHPIVLSVSLLGAQLKNAVKWPVAQKEVALHFLQIRLLQDETLETSWVAKNRGTQRHSSLLIILDQLLFRLGPKGKIKP